MSEGIEKKPPFHEVMIGMLTGEYKEELSAISCGCDTDRWATAAVIGFAIIRAHLPESAVEPMAIALVKCTAGTQDKDARSVCCEALSHLDQASALQTVYGSLEDPDGNDGIAADDIEDMAKELGIKLKRTTDESENDPK